MSLISKLNAPGILPHPGKPPKYSNQILQADQETTNELRLQEQEKEHLQETIVSLHSQVQPASDHKMLQSKAAEEKLTKLEEAAKRLKDLKPSSGLDAEEMVTIAKKKLLTSMINSARMLLSSKYTAKSWTKMVDAMKSVLSVANSQNPKSSDLDKAIGVLLIGLSVLEYTDSSVQDKGVRENLPNDLEYKQNDSTSSLKAAGANVNVPADSGPAVSVANAANVVNISV